MKKLVSSVLVLCMIAVALAGCGNKNTETTKATEATASTEAAVSTEAVSETQAAEGEAATVQVYIAASLSNAMDEISANYKSVRPMLILSLMQAAQASFRHRSKKAALVMYSSQQQQSR